MNYNPIILALDYNNLDDARNILNRVRSNIGMIKVGLELFTACGKEALTISKEFNIPVFLDLKLHDVPTTVSKTTSVICEMLALYQGEHFLSVHCSGGATMTASAALAARSSNVHIVGITVMTSLTQSDVKNIYDTRQISIHSAWLAELSKQNIPNHLDHFVCAPASLKVMRKRVKNNPILITPGIRGPHEQLHDHRNPQTINHALKEGTNWVVIGRPITQASDPAEAAKYFKQQTDKF
jgi:orotidine-5'-phosphate decarboxylase